MVVGLLVQIFIFFLFFFLPNHDNCNFSGVEVPVAVLGAEIDQLSPPSLLKQFEEVISAKSEVIRASALF